MQRIQQNDTADCGGGLWRACHIRRHCIQQYRLAGAIAGECGLICRLQRPRNIEIPAGIPCGVPVLLVVGIGGVGVLDGRS